MNKYKIDEKVGELSVFQELSPFTDSHIDKNIMVVTNNKCYYVDNSGNRTEYSNMKDAIMDHNSSFSGTVRFDQDVTENFSLVDFDNYNLLIRFLIQNRNLVFDLNGHTWNVQNAENDFNIHYLFYLNGNCELTIKNGTLICKNMTALKTGGGTINLNNLKLTTNIRMDVIPSNGTKKAKMFIDRSSELTFLYEWYDLRNSQGNPYYDNFAPGIWLFGAQITSFPNWEEYKTTDGTRAIYHFLEDFEDYMPTVYVDGKITSQVGEGQAEGKTCDMIFTSGHSNVMPVKYVIGKNANLYAKDGNAIFMNNYGKIQVLGGRIAGNTAIVLRSGVIHVPKDANPTVIGTGFNKYNPGIASGQGTTDLNILGNALVLESYGGGYGNYSVLDRQNDGLFPSALIESGEFISLKNTPIGSYSHYDQKTQTYKQRVTGFVYGGILDREPSQSEYVQTDGSHCDYGILAEGCQISSICEINKNN